MDLRRLRVGEWILAISGLALLVSLFLPWSDADRTGWESLSVLDVLLMILGLAALAIWLITAIAKTTAPGLASQSLLVPFALVMAVVALFQLGEFDRVGAYVAIAAVLGVLVGDLMAMRDERLSKPGRPTDQTGVPVSAPLAVEKLPGPPSA